MNERIEKLAIECYQAPEFDYKKFAELIVRECAMACEKNSYLALNGWQRAKQIKEHFGVE
jgi:hypothetical protein